LGRLKLTAIRIEEEDLIKAKKLGINISQVCRNAVKEAIRRMESPSTQEKPKNTLNSRLVQSSKNLLVRLPGFEPGLPAWQADVLTKLDDNRDNAHNFY
jgi:post-segregation antitoxin (ccd killing protein)